jgi:hypothetical protein
LGRKITALAPNYSLKARQEFVKNLGFRLQKLFVSRMGKENFFPAAGVFFLLTGAMMAHAGVASTDAGCCAPERMPITWHF